MLIRIYRHARLTLLNRDECLATVMKQQSAQCDPEVLDSGDGMFFLYTSGSTGKPKGILHSTGGYLVHAIASFKLTFDYQESDISFSCSFFHYVGFPNPDAL